MRRILFVLAFILLLIPVFMWRTSAPADPVSSNYTQKPITLGDTHINADIADTEALRERGLSGRESLAENQGMLFVFQDDDAHSFWMKDMKFAIDMIWVSKDMHVVYIAKDARPESYPSSFMPTEPSRYVIEVPAGFVYRHNISVGTRVSF